MKYTGTTAKRTQVQHKRQYKQRGAATEQGAAPLLLCGCTILASRLFVTTKRLKQ